MQGHGCPFCEPEDARVVIDGSLVRALWDGFPISPGHALIVPKRHVASWFGLAADEKAEMVLLLDDIKARLDVSFAPDGFNIGINDGVAAGQTIGHAHMHVIPRYTGDMADPRGGIRWIISSKADYWSGNS
jgi:diadenosine tetraphosphate (Ap4A) HIT family hydrolase